MPYIKREDRIKFMEEIFSLVTKIESPGELNFVITTICTAFLSRKKESYADLNSVIGVLECAKLEFYRRVVSGYENQKFRLNGDVY